MHHRPSEMVHVDTILCTLYSVEDHTAPPYARDTQQARHLLGRSPDSPDGWNPITADYESNPAWRAGDGCEK